MALYREDSTGFLCEFATYPGAGYTAVSAMPTDTLANRVNWYRTIDLDDLSSEWHPSLQGGSEVAAPPGISGTGVNIMAWRYSSFEEPDGLPSLVLTNVTAARNAVGYNGQYKLSLTASANNGTAYLTPLSNVYNIKLTQNLRWIVSLYCSPSTSGEKTFSCLVKTANSGTIYELPFTTGATAGQWTRVYAELDLRADTSVGAMLGFKIASSGVRIDFDAIMMEELIGGVATPSAYYAPISYVDGAQIVNGSITGTEIANATITADNITNATITGAKIASATITGGNIASATITSSQIANATITAGNIANAAITASQIANLTITANQIANLTLTGSKIADATITNAKINDLSANKLTAGTIDASVITVSNINAGNITTGNLSATRISGGTLNASTITVSNLRADSITVGTLTTGQITDGAITDSASNYYQGLAINLTSYSPITVWTPNQGASTFARKYVEFSGVMNLEIYNSGQAVQIYIRMLKNGSEVARVNVERFATSSNGSGAFCVPFSYTDTSIGTSAANYSLTVENHSSHLVYLDGGTVSWRVAKR